MFELFIKQNKINQQRMTVRDHRGQILYVIERRWGRKDDVMAIYSLSGDQLMRIAQTKSSPLPVFDILEHNEKTGTIRKHPGLLGIRDTYFTVHPHDWVVAGDFEDLYITVTKKHDMIMECEKFVYANSDIYELTVDEEENIPLCALLSVIFDPYSRIKKEEKEEENVYEENYRLGFGNCFSLTTDDYFSSGMKTAKEKTR